LGKKRKNELWRGKSDRTRGTKTIPAWCGVHGSNEAFFQKRRKASGNTTIVDIGKLGKNPVKSRRQTSKKQATGGDMGTVRFVGCARNRQKKGGGGW